MIVGMTGALDVTLCISSVAGFDVESSPHINSAYPINPNVLQSSRKSGSNVKFIH